MAIGKTARLGFAAAALTLVATAGLASTPAATRLPTVTVHHNPT